jgi:predicted O-methyltransferase YrrM
MMRWVDEFVVEVGGTRFRTLGAEEAGDRALEKVFFLGSLESTADLFVMLKTRPLLDRFVELIAELRPQHIFEMGIFKGGSVAFLAALAEPSKFVAIEHKHEPVEVLEEHLVVRDLRERVRTYYGVDQADGPRVSAIVAEEFGDEALDLVVDDASHRYDLTRSSFETLFPLLRPGGVYVIEDWSWGSYSMEAPILQEHMATTGSPLVHLVFELVLVAGTAPGMISQVAVYPNVLMVHRGPAPLEPGRFSLDEWYDPEWRSGRPVVPHGSRQA